MELVGLYDILRPMLFAADPEWVHDRILTLLSKGAFGGRRVPQGLETQTLGLNFTNPLGIAAGFDKNGVGVHAWHLFGFGFAEIGTITRFPQPGNPKPRLFRLPEDEAIINRMGFNNDGADAVARRLEASYSAKGKPPIPIGINVGKSKVVSPERAFADALYSIKLLKPYGDYFVVNVSSPNTPGLRDLQSKHRLERLIGSIRGTYPEIKLLFKVAPDLGDEPMSMIDDFAQVAVDFEVDGIIATNTTVARSDLKSLGPYERGGLSGAPLFHPSTHVLGELCTRLPESVALIGVGGVMNRDHYLAKLQAGANLVQVYTGWIYGGLDFASEVLTQETA